MQVAETKSVLYAFSSSRSCRKWPSAYNNTHLVLILRAVYLGIRVVVSATSTLFAHQCSQPYTKLWLWCSIALSLKCSADIYFPMCNTSKSPLHYTRVKLNSLNNWENTLYYKISYMDILAYFDIIHQLIS